MLDFCWSLSGKTIDLVDLNECNRDVFTCLCYGASTIMQNITCNVIEASTIDTYCVLFRWEIDLR